MYWQYFGLKENPFGITPDPRYLFLSTPHSMAIEWMKMALEQREFGLIIGEVGSGKTVISRYIIDLVKSDEYKIAWIINPTLSVTQLLREIYTQLFEAEAPKTKSAVISALHEGLVELYLDKKFPIVIIDEAQSIPGSKVFEELRLLSNYQTDDSNLLSIILLGQPELATKLKRKHYRAFLQRIRFTINLEALSEDELENYLIHRLKVAGGNDGKIFEKEACNYIHKLTKGYPRPANHLASFAMMAAMSKEMKKVNKDIVKQAAQSILYFQDQLNKEE